MFCSPFPSSSESQGQCFCLRLVEGGFGGFMLTPEVWKGWFQHWSRGSHPPWTWCAWISFYRFLSRQSAYARSFQCFWITNTTRRTVLFLKLVLPDSQGCTQIMTVIGHCDLFLDWDVCHLVSAFFHATFYFGFKLFNLHGITICYCSNLKQIKRRQ